MVTIQDKLIVGAIGAVVGILAALGIIVIHQRMGGISAGDVLQFLGGVTGTALAIGGAVWIEERKRKQERADAATPVLEALIGLERKSRPFFDLIDQRRENAEVIDRQMILLEDILKLSPPRSARLIGLFYDLKLGATFLTCDAFLEMNDKAPRFAAPERHRVEKKLEYFDTPLKLLIVAYSRLVDPKAPRSVAHLKIRDT